MRRRAALVLLEGFTRTHLGDRTDIDLVGEQNEVVQLYITRTEVSVTQPVLLLKGFERVALAPGESGTVRFSLTPSHLAFWNRDLREVNEPGPVAVRVGNSSANLKTAQLVIA